MSPRSLTLFSIPKPFVGHIHVIQRNAIETWRRLCPAYDIVLCGDEAGTAEVAAEYNLCHLPDLARNEYGTPFLHSALEQVRRFSTKDRLCYVNTDIILLDDFARAISQVELDQCLMVGQRWDVDLNQPWDFTQPAWQHRLRQFVDANAKPHSLWGIDYFVFPREGTLDRLPPFVVGRPGWDNWVIYDARSRGIPVVDLSPVAQAIHQNHGYDHVPLRSGERWVGPEAHQHIRLLFELMNGNTTRFAIADATHLLTPDGLQRPLNARAIRRWWETLDVLHPQFKSLKQTLDPIVHAADWIWSTLRQCPKEDRH